MMRNLGFRDHWISLVMRCITTVSYSILINAQLDAIMKPKRGIKKGDLISPYLYLLCAEGISALLTKAECNSSIHGIGVVSQAPSINHLFFTDDSLLFYHANRREWLKTQDLLQIYANASG